LPTGVAMIADRTAFSMLKTHFYLFILFYYQNRTRSTHKKEKHKQNKTNKTDKATETKST